MHTTMVVLRNVTESAQALLRCCSQPQDRIPVAVGELWRYESWIAWIRDSQVREVWVVNQRKQIAVASATPCAIVRAVRYFAAFAAFLL
jgi:hypothetical protein